VSARRFARILAAALACALPCAPAAAGETLRGTVLGVLPAKHLAIVAHDAFGGMPAMTMGFTVSAADAARLHDGDVIEAAVRETGGAQTLAEIRILGSAKTAAGGTMRSVPLLQPGDPAPATRFIAQDGKPFTLADFRGKIVLLSFIYTRCRDARMCPLISANFHLVQKKLGAGPYHLVEITLDPDFDTPAVLAAYGKLFDFDPSMWTLGTGPKDDVLDFAARFGIAPFQDPKAGIIHSERTAVIGNDGRIADLIDEAGWNPDEVVARVHSLGNTPSNPIALLDYNLSRAAISICGNGVAGYSGLLDLGVVLLIFAAAMWALVRVGRFIFTAKA
jgi:protein SCO1/2